MAGILVSAATGALNSIVEKLGTLLVDQYKLHTGVRGEIKFLTGELTAMNDFLLKMSEEEDPDQQDKVWMSKVRELSYDIEDSIDDFMQDEDDKDAKPDGIIKKIKHILGKVGKRKAHHQVFQDLKKQVTEVAERNQRYQTRHALSKARNLTVDPRALAIFDLASTLVGIDEPKAELIKLLIDGVSINRQPKLVSIVGSAGIGKTTLANQVYQDLKRKFKYRAFLSVSRNPDMMNIMRIIHSQVSGLRFADTEAGSIQQVIINITTFLAEKRYFVVVDDIWDVAAWNVIKLAFPKTSSRSIIITTTRRNDVAESCSSYFSGNIYGVRPLTVVHSRQLFHRRLFDSQENCPPYLEEVCDQILKKCAGLPLAIIAVSGLLANIERTEDRWNQMKHSICRALETNPYIEGMMKILSFSYFDLPPYLKNCLLYVSMFSEDSFIEKYDLIRRWIGEGFIQKEDGYTTHEVGERCFNELVNRCLIQSVETNEYGKVKACRVHDIILDFIISKSTEENFITFLSTPIPTTGTESKVIRQLFLQGVKEGNSTIPTTGLDLSHVRSVSGSFVEMPSLEKFRHLRVLNLHDYQRLGEQNLENIVRLFQLRYLSFRHIGIRKLPEQIGRLGCLEILDLRETDVMELPASIVDLRKLSHLLVDVGVKFPDGVANMQALETLKLVSVSRQSLDFLSSLGQLKNLRNLVLHIRFNVNSDTGHTNVIGEVISSLCKLGTQNLRSLTIMDLSGLLQEPLCLPTLEKLINCSLAIPQIPKWLSSLKNLQQLILQVDGVKQDDLCMLGALPTLLILHLTQRTESRNKLRISGEVGFRSLRIFIYDGNGVSPVALIFAAGSMPKLEKLKLVCHVNESDSPSFGIENLPCLRTVKCFVNGNDGIVEAVETAVETAASTHPNHPSLGFWKGRAPGGYDPGHSSVGRQLSMSNAGDDGYEQGQSSQVEGGNAYGYEPGQSGQVEGENADGDYNGEVDTDEVDGHMQDQMEEEDTDVERGHADDSDESDEEENAEEVPNPHYTITLMQRQIILSWQTGHSTGSIIAGSETAGTN
ncbi:disease resistance protein RGA5-like [Triticum dicoccoides]|uniref:disease resistance protein RGA5-like n=1 Tax=Triticum dicoccoides TaxID=85692 RepID=UPI001891A173|nr:disease resistance protein RGA5-like [Triticum dicoccoides]